MLKDTAESRARKTRREFFRNAAQLSAGAVTATLLGSVERAFAIEPPAGSTYLDAEHVVVLMQENRSFDHAYGTLRGVRGFGDPRAVTLPDQNPVWLQSNAAGETYAPFRLDIAETKATWLGSLPHSWADQSDARHHGNHDKWLDAKPSGRKDCAGKPLTLGYYDRRDLPFYYSLADAFTICDQNFCSSLTGTTPNRLYLWTGTIREKQDAAARANVWNSDVDYEATVKWTTFPERLEDAGVSWKIYQNEISLPSGLEGEEDAWLSNFTDNPIEWFDQYHVRFSKTFRAYAQRAVGELPAEIAALEKKIAAADPATSARLSRQRRDKERLLKMVSDAANYTDAAYARLPQRERKLHEKAFSTNAADPAYRQLATLDYRDGSAARQMKVPKGDVLHQFRQDVAQGKLPAVSWIVPPENFSDHPGAPWYGSWMVSEVLNILTKNPEVWKKTIFVLTYDENDGYFDHVPPFVAPDPARPESGKVSEGIDAAVECWPLERDREHQSPKSARGGPIGLGFRVPMVIASPWSRGGYVCSQVFDHTSVLQLLENVVTHKLGRPIRESNISSWRRAVCGDLSSTFQPASATAGVKLPFTSRDAVLESIHKAQFKDMPSGYRKLSAADIAQSRAWMPKQEKGVRPSLPLPYELHATAQLSAGRKSLEIAMESGKSAGSAFHAYTPGKYKQQAELRTRAYAVAPGKRVTDTWDIDGFEGGGGAGTYHLRVCGPNGFLREFTGTADDPAIELQCHYLPTGDLEVSLTNHDSQARSFQVIDESYQTGTRSASVKPGAKESMTLHLTKSHSWYDFTVKVAGADHFARRCAGHVETGKSSYSDPAMG